MVVNCDIVADGEEMKSEKKEKQEEKRSGVSEVVNMAFVEVAWIVIMVFHFLVRSCIVCSVTDSMSIPV